MMPALPCDIPLNHIEPHDWPRVGTEPVLSPFPGCLGHWKSHVLGPGDVPDAPGQVHRLRRPERPQRTRRRPRNHRQSRVFQFHFFSLTFFRAHYLISGMITIKFESELPRF